MFPCSVSFPLRHRVSWIKVASRRGCDEGKRGIMSRNPRIPEWQGAPEKETPQPTWAACKKEHLTAFLWSEDEIS